MKDARGYQSGDPGTYCRDDFGRLCQNDKVCPGQNLGETSSNTIPVVQIKLIRRPRITNRSPVYLLDLDNTLHHASTYILPEINRQMTQYLVEQLQVDHARASQIRTDYWRRYGATLLGMMQHHQTDPHDFLEATHQFPDLAGVSHRPSHVPYRLSRLNGLRILLTNAPRAYAVDLLRILDLYRHVDAVVAIEDMVIHQRWRPKPSNWLWQRLKQVTRAKKLVLVDDTRGHLLSAAKFGIEGIWITNPEFKFSPRLPKGRVRVRIKHFNQVQKKRV